MTDIVERLNNADLLGRVERVLLCGEAAEEIRRLNGAMAGRSVDGKIADDLRQELQILRRLYEAKSVECARLQRIVEGAKEEIEELSRPRNGQ